ncbi:MAG: PEP-utilizing enzyme [Patescibacteria group bacterium]|nr:PEP-utilizing enzyme [Patescibacteria group bacterium]
MSKKVQNLWRKNFDIRRVDFCLPVETAPGFGGLNFLTNGKNSISRFIWVVENLDNTGTYFLKHELREIVELTMKTILENPKRADAVHQEAIKLNWDYYKLALKMRRLPFAKLTDKQLLAWQKKLFNLQFLSHCWSLPTTWFLDSDGEDFSKHLTAFLQDRIKKLGLAIEPALAFSVLSTPRDESFTAKEEKASLKILSWMNETLSLKLWLQSQTDGQMVKNLRQLPKPWIKIIEKHHYDFCWLPYTYIGPAYGLDYYLETWRGLLQEDFDPKKRMEELESRAKAVQEQKKELVGRLKLSALEKHWFKIAADIVWLKGFRKETFFHGFYTMDMLLKEIGKRSGLSTLQTKYLLPSELPKALAGKDFAGVVNERQRFSVIYGQTPKNYKALKKGWTEKGVTVFTGQKAKTFLKKQKFEKIKVVQTNDLTGTCACPGAAKGTIRIINVPEEIGKMNPGDIMLSHTTFPSLVPAMKKASAIITEDGGITCHAAIVARELQTPCVVGCKHALQILKDGDMVEIDATKGLIKKL